MNKGDNRYIAVYNLTAFHGIGILEIEEGIESYCVCEYFGGVEVKTTKNKIYTDRNSRNYIKKYNKRYYLDEFIKC